MSISIRLSRTGRKNLPSFRVVVANTRSKRNGKVLDTIGWYNPSEKDTAFTYDKDKLAVWQSRGAMLTTAVQNLLEDKYTFIAYPSAKKVKREAKRAAERASKQAPATQEAATAE